MKVQYRSKRINGMIYYPPVAGEANYIIANITSPRTGRTFGYKITDVCGDILVEGPTFIWPAIKVIIAEHDGKLKEALYDIPRVPNMINEAYMNA